MADFLGYVPAPNRNAALLPWAAQGMMGPRPAPPPAPPPMNVPQGMNPYDLGPPVHLPDTGVITGAPVFLPDDGSYRAGPVDLGGVSIPYPSDINPPPLIGGLEQGLTTPEPYTPGPATRQVTPSPYGGVFGRPNPASPGRAPFALPPSSGRYRSGVPQSDFIYTNPAAAAQATAALQARIGYDQANEQGYRQYQIAQQQADQASAMQQQRVLEAEKDRQLQREGFASSERSAQNRSGFGQSEYDRREASRQKELQDQKRLLDIERYRQASSIAAALNNPNLSPSEKARLKQDPNTLGVVHQDPNGNWVPSLNNPEAEVPPTASTIRPIEQVLPRAGTPPAPPTGGGSQASPMFPGPPPPPPAPPKEPWLARWFGHPSAPLQGVP